MTAPIPGYPAYTITRAGVITNGNGQPIKAKRGRWVSLTDARGKRVSCSIKELIYQTYGYPPEPPEPMTETERRATRRDAILAAAKSETSTVHMMADDLARGVKRMRSTARFSESDALEVLGAIGMWMLQEAR